MGATASLSQGAAAIGGAYAQSRAIQAQGDYQKRMFDLNSQFANFQAEDAIKRGEKAVAVHKTATKKLIGSQRAALAAQGIEVNSGSAADVQADTAGQSAVDELTIRNNAWREAWGYRVQATQMTGRGAFASMAANSEATNTLLTGGMRGLGYGMDAYGKYEAKQNDRGYEAMRSGTLVSGGSYDTSTYG